jgi:hypothetical protein
MGLKRRLHSVRRGAIIGAMEDIGIHEDAGARAGCRATLILGAALLLTACSAPVSDRSPRATDVSPETYYLHIYSTRYENHDISETYGRGERYVPRENRRLATISVTPGIPFFAELPNHYEPEIQIKGSLGVDAGRATGTLDLLVLGVDVAYLHEQRSAFSLNELVGLDGVDDFSFALSASTHPYAIDLAPADSSVGAKN